MADPERSARRMAWRKAEISDYLRILAACGAAMGLALALRHLFLDSDATRRLCEARPDAWFCGLRGALAYGLRHPAAGWLIALAGLVAVARPNLPRLALALVLAALGLVLYQASLASGIAALLLIRLGLSDPPRD